MEKEAGNGANGTRRVSRRDFLKVGGVGLAGAALLGVAGCGGGGQQSDVGSPSGSNLIVGYDQEPDTLNRYITGGDALSTASTTAGILQSVIYITPDLGYAPLLAESMPKLVSEDPQIVEYRLKDGLTWSDGKPLTSADAKWTFEQIMNPDNDILTRIGFEDIERFETPDERTVRMVFGQPYAPWKDLLANDFPILPKHVYEDEDFNEALNDEVIGSGPFKLKEWNKGQDLTVERNDNYWGEKPAIKKFTYRFIPDTNSLIAALEAGEVFFIYPPPDIGLLERLRGIEGTQVKFKAGVVWEHIAFNLDKVPNLKLRQAIAYGINRAQVVEELLKGVVGTLDSWLVPQQDPYYSPSWERYTFDPDRARQLVRQAESEGASTSITFSTTSDNRLRETLQQIVQRQLKDVGIDVSIKNSSATPYFGQVLPAGDYEMGEWAWLATPDPSQTEIFSADQIPTEQDPAGSNYYWYDSQEVTALLKESDRTLDVQQRAEILERVQDRMAEDVPIIPMYQRPEYYAFSDSLAGPEVNPSLAGPFWNMGEWSLKG